MSYYLSPEQAEFIHRLSDLKLKVEYTDANKKIKKLFVEMVDNTIENVYLFDDQEMEELLSELEADLDIMD